MGLEKHLQLALESIGVHYGDNIFLDYDGERLILVFRGVPLKEQRRIIRFLRKNRQFNPVWRGKRVILEPMGWAGGKKRY